MKSHQIKHILLFLILIFPATLLAQQQQLIDSLLKVLPQKTGEEKVHILSDLCYYNRFLDRNLAEKYGLEALNYANQIKYPKGIAQALNDLGIILIDKSNYSEALTHFHKALKIREQLKDTLGIAALYNKIGIAHQHMRNLPEALQAALKALKIYEEKGLENYAAYCVNNIAILYYNQNNYQKALDYHKQARNYRNKINQEYELGVSYLNIGNIYNEIGQFDYALANFDSALYYLQKYPNLEGLGSVLTSLGAYYKNIGDFEKAADYVRQSIKIKEAQENITFLTSSQVLLGGILIDLKKYTEAENILRKAVANAKKHYLKEHKKSAYQNLALLFEQQRNLDSALHYFGKFSITKDSILNESVNKTVAEMHTAYETEKKEQEIVKLSQEQKIKDLKLHQRNILLALVTTTLLLLLVFGWLFYLRYKTKQEQKLQQAVIEEQQRGLKAVIIAQEDERQRIAKDLHDGIGQTLSGIKLAMQRLAEFVVSEKQNDFNKLTQIIDEACTEVRNISHQMMPKALQEKGLVDALNDMLEKSLGMTDIKYTFENFNVAGKRFEKHIEIGLFRIAQELVNNIIKHSEAHHVDVQLNLLKSHLILLVVDNGKGFTFDSQKDGIGLMNIKTRANTFNGEINYESAPGSGTTATIRIPVTV